MTAEEYKLAQLERDLDRIETMIEDLKIEIAYVDEDELTPVDQAALGRVRDVFDRLFTKIELKYAPLSGTVSVGSTPSNPYKPIKKDT